MTMFLLAKTKRPSFRPMIISSFLFVCLSIFCLTTTCGFLSTANTRTTRIIPQTKKRLLSTTTSLFVSNAVPTIQDISSPPPSSKTKTTKRTTTKKTDTVVVVGRNQWQQINGNFILRPSSSYDPRGIILFLGGAIVGAVPHVTYQHLLNELSKRGFIIVATPYNLSLSHLETTREIMNKLEGIPTMLRNQYNNPNLPLIGMGHSCGSLLHLLMSTNMISTTSSNNNELKKMTNIFMSFNNKPFREACPIPLDEINNSGQNNNIMLAHSQWLATAAMRHHRNALQAHLFVLSKFSPSPFVRQRAKTIRRQESERLFWKQNNNNYHEQISIYLQLLSCASKGELPSDALLQKVLELDPILPLQVAQSAHIPESVRKAFRQFFLPTSTALERLGISSLVDTLPDQVPSLVQQVLMTTNNNNKDGGIREFDPSPQSVRQLAPQSYHDDCESLFVKFQTDGIDESDDMASRLLLSKEEDGINKQQQQPKRIHQMTLPGGHAAPLTKSQVQNVANHIVEWMNQRQQSL